MFEPQGASGRSALADAPRLETRATAKVRGSSSGNFVKHPFRLEAVDDQDRDRDVSPLGLPADADWILNARSLFDQSLMANAFMYSLSNQTGRYAVRTRFVELFTNTDDGVLSQNDYAGVYALMETVKRGPNRVNVEKLSQNYDTEPLTEGGYIFKIDRHDIGDPVFEAGGRTLVYVEPDEVEINEPIRQPQKEFLKEYVDQTVWSLEDRDPVRGYVDQIDVDSWIDHHLLNTLAANGDGLNLSTYISKRRDGKLEFGPIWDFDRSMGSPGTQPRGGSAGWAGKSTFPWWRTLFEDPDFRQRYADRYQQLRQDVWSTENINATIDALVGELTDEAAERNFERWPGGLNFVGWRGEVGELRRWLVDRVAWLDAQLIPQPIVAEEAEVDAGTRSVTMSLPAGAPAGMKLFYTLDGSDPRRSAFDVLSEAVRERRDLHQTADGIFAVDLPNGTYEVTVVQGDVARPHEQMATAVEGVAIGPPISTSTGQFVRRTATVDITDGQLSLSLDALGDDTQQAVINGLEIVPLAGPQQIAFDFGPDDAPVAAGFTQVGAEAFDDAVGFGWTSGTVKLFDRGVPEDARRDLARVEDQVASFAVRVPSGRYNVTVVMGDEERERLDMQVRLEPGETSAVSRRVKGNAGDHDRQGQLVEVLDGQLDVELTHVGNNNTQAVINALIISPVLTFDFGTASSPVEPGSIRVDTTPYDPAVGYGWTEGTITASDRRDLVEGGGVAPSAVETTGGEITFGAQGELRVRAFLPGSTRRVGTASQPVFWSRETVVAAESPRLPLAITEINYHPEAPTADERSQDADLTASDFEFVELTNVTGQPVDLAGWQFADGIDFTFPQRTVEPGGVVLVVRNAAAFQVRYPSVDMGAVVGEFSGRLANGGELLLLSDAMANRQIEFAYGDTAPWPEQADGEGQTLILIDPAGTPAGAYGDADRWQASDVRGGTPGRGDLVDAVLAGDMDRDGDVDFDDISVMVRGLNDPAGYESIYSVSPQLAGDFTGDGTLDMDDIERFARLLVEGGA
ncbi:MAG: CotH kinase family protein [Pirellulales bacterium]